MFTAIIIMPFILLLRRFNDCLQNVTRVKCDTHLIIFEYFLNFEHQIIRLECAVTASALQGQVTT
jgi:hypothetical protein